MKKLLLLLALLSVGSVHAADVWTMKPVETYKETGTDIDATAYNQVASVTGYTAAAVWVQNTTDVAVKIAVGAASSEVDVPQYVAAGKEAIINLPVAKGSRLSVRAITSDATSGMVVITLMH